MTKQLERKARGGIYFLHLLFIRPILKMGIIIIQKSLINGLSIAGTIYNTTK